MNSKKILEFLGKFLEFTRFLREILSEVGGRLKRIVNRRRSKYFEILKIKLCSDRYVTARRNEK